jgi:hypothetical protein
LSSPGLLKRLEYGLDGDNGGNELAVDEVGGGFKNAMGARWGGMIFRPLALGAMGIPEPSRAGGGVGLPESGEAGGTFGGVIGVPGIVRLSAIICWFFGSPDHSVKPATAGVGGNWRG